MGLFGLWMEMEGVVMNFSEWELTLIQMCRKRARSTGELMGIFIRNGKDVSYNYLNRVLNDLSEKGFMKKIKQKGMYAKKNGRSRMTFFVSKPYGINAVKDFLIEQEALSKEKRMSEKVGLMMDNQSLSMFCK